MHDAVTEWPDAAFLLRAAVATTCYRGRGYPRKVLSVYTLTGPLGRFRRDQARGTNRLSLAQQILDRWGG